MPIEAIAGNEMSFDPLRIATFNDESNYACISYESVEFDGDKELPPWTKNPLWELSQIVVSIRVPH